MEPTDRAAAFEQHRAHLTGVAYRMLGTVTDAEDAVQEAYLRFAPVNSADIRDLRAWLTTTVARICLDELGSARARHEAYIGQWLPEPVGSGPGSPPAALSIEDRVTLDESVSVAMLVVLESLSPAERIAFVLHDVLGFSYGDVATVVGRSELACRQLVSRARASVQRRKPRFSPDRSEHAGAVEAFLAACANGSYERLVQVLDSDVVLRSDGGGRVPGVARRPVSGSAGVARLLLGVAAKNSNVRLAFHTINGSPGLLFEAEGKVVGVMCFMVSSGKITEIDFVVNPDKLRRIGIHR